MPREENDAEILHNRGPIITPIPNIAAITPNSFILPGMVGDTSVTYAFMTALFHAVIPSHTLAHAITINGSETPNTFQSPPTNHAMPSIIHDMRVPRCVRSNIFFLP
jgi:hypothetical protein